MSDERPAALPATYAPGETEPAQYAAWEGAHTFRADPAESHRSGGPRDPFTIVIPPPNVTAVLHMGHGLNNTVQDVLIRWRRMAGDAALWVPGTDHAGIATQNVVEKQLAAEGTTRFDVGREAFVERVRGFVDRTGGEILGQLRAIGASADWTRTAYTFSPALSRAVREAFVRLYERGLVYKGHRVIHWCPRCLTSLSDEEAEFHDETGGLHHIAYPVQGDPARTLVVATTRPETMLGDVAVAVHPNDERYRDLVGRHVVLPLVGVAIPVVADAYADPAFGTGVVKITPAHDANDFEVGRRHGLPAPVVLDEHGVVREGADAGGRVPAAFAGLDRAAARDAIVAALRAAGALVRVTPHAHAVRRCYRCDTVVEPRLSDQWFVRMAPLAAPALAAVRDGTVRILPERWEAVYVQWMEHIRDWNISRQIWWGHRVPVWYDRDGGVHVRRDDPTPDEIARLGLVQDPDVLDTWFSSWLWPLSTLGWPDDDTADQRAFYPTDVLVTAPEILFFWVARMMMAGYAFRGAAPFHTVYLHGTVRDAQHRKMSKSLGNGIDPLDVVRQYGADALRWTVISGLGLGADLQLDHEDIEQTFAPGRNFCTKLWNIGRFLLSNIGDTAVPAVDALPTDALTAADRWILARLDVAITDCDAALGPPRPRDGRWRPEERYAGLRLSEYAEAARRFAWNELADWYVEAVKDRVKAGGPDGEAARAVLVHAFDQALRLLHPVVPFITEAIWQRLPGRAAGAFLATAAWPRPSGVAWDAAPFARAQEVVLALRQIRGDYGVAPGATLTAHLTGPVADVAAAHRVGAPLAARLARTTLLATPAPDGAAAHALLTDGVELVVPLAGAVDLGRECAKLRTELDGLERQLTSLEGRLANEKFTAKAPPAVVAAERTKAAEWAARRDQLRTKVRALCGD
jgi:valyl-tRNA synthetase